MMTLPTSVFDDLNHIDQTDISKLITDQKYINEETTLVDFYYEIYGHNNCAFRISFINLLV